MENCRIQIIGKAVTKPGRIEGGRGLCFDIRAELPMAHPSADRRVLMDIHCLAHGVMAERLEAYLFAGRSVLLCGTLLADPAGPGGWSIEVEDLVYLDLPGWIGEQNDVGELLSCSGQFNVSPDHPIESGHVELPDNSRSRSATSPATTLMGH